MMEMEMATVKVRIAVAMDPEGDWIAYGCNNWTDPSSEIRSSGMLDTLHEGEQVVIVEAYIPIPDTRTITGEVAPSHPAVERGA
jgi:hypothetical protein